MSIHEHDFDAITNLVSEGGALDADANACEVCRAEYATQVQVRSLLMHTPLPEMSGPELATLRSGVNEALGSPANRRLRRLVTAASVAAGFLVIVGLGPVLLGGQQEDTIALQTSDTTAAASVAEDAARTAATESAAPVAGAAEMASDGFSEIRDAGAVNEDELRALEDEMRDTLESSALKLGPAEYSSRERVIPPCIPDAPVFGSIEADLDGRPVVSYLIEEEDGVRLLERYDAATCELLDRR